LLRRAAQRTALVLVFDDLDRADRPSLRLLEFAATELAAARILFIGLYRSCELAVEHPLAATLAELSRHPRFESHRLAGLAPEETRALVAARADGDPPPEVVETIQQRSEGNPFFACALADQWVERKLAGEVAGRVVPPSIRELVRGRLLRLPKPCREVLEAAAPIGREFPIDLLARVCGLEEEELLDALDQARRAGLVELLNGNAQRFVHALVQEVIYAELLPSLRRELHERVAEALDAEGGREHLGEIARHFALAAADSTGERAVESAVRAAEEAERRLAFADEPGLYELAVEALARVRPLDRVRRCDLLLALARACLRDREITQADHAAQRAAELARELGSPARLAQAALVLAEHVTVRSIDVVPILDEALAALPPDPTPLRARVLSQVSRHLLFSEQHERRQRLADEAVSIARAAADQVALAEALIAKRGVLAVPTRLAERLAVISEAVACADAAPGSACRVHARAWRAVDRLEAGDVEAADRDVEAVQRIAFDEGLLRFESLPPRWSAMQAVLQGRFRDAEQAIGEAYRAMWRARDPNALPCVAVQVTALLAEQGRWEPLEALLVQALGERRPGGLSRAASAFLAWLALERGRLEKARRRFDRAAADGFEALAQAPDFLAAASFLAEMCARYDEPGPAARLYSHLAPYADRIVVFEHALACRGSASYFLGLLARASGRLDEAACHLEAALAINAKLGAVPYVARTQLELARALRARARSGDLDQACALLRDAARVGARLGLRDLAGSASALMH
jgi:tetratricopeptide (TPR) repeat protein